MKFKLLLYYPVIVYLMTLKKDLHMLELASTTA